MLEYHIYIMEGNLIHINRGLLPLAWIYGFVVGLRNKLFDCGILESRSYPIPTISVGNLTVGGTGKTPHIEYLIRLLGKKYQVAVLSRGYKRESKGYVLANVDTPMEEIGDEPWQMKQKFPDVRVAVDSNRRRGIERLLSEKETSCTEVILLDDAFQHRHIKPGCNILLIDYSRMITLDELIPAGRLREPYSGKERADIVIVTKCPQDLQPIDYRMVEEGLRLRPYQELFFSGIRYGNLVNMTGDRMMYLKELKWHNILLLTGIGNPHLMETDMKSYARSVEAMAFSDHHRFTHEDIIQISSRLGTMPEDSIIVTTEKDIARLMNRTDIPQALGARIWVIPIQIKILQDKQTFFNDKITGYVQENSRNHRMAESQDDKQA